VIARAHPRRVELALHDGAGGEPAAQRREADSFRRQGVRESRGVPHQQHAPPRERPGPRAHGDHEPVSLDRAGSDLERAQVLREVAVQVARAATRAQHTHRKMRGFGEHPRVAVGDDPDVEARRPRPALERRVVHVDLVLERGDEVPPVAPPGLAGHVARRSVGRDHERRRDGTTVGVEPDMAVLEAHAAHAARRAQLRACRRGAGREQEVETVPHRHRRHRDGPPCREVQVVVQQVELGRAAAALHHVLNVGWEQVEAASDHASAARLVARERCFLEDHDLEPLPREGERGGRPGGAAADDGDVEHHDP